MSELAELIEKWEKGVARCDKYLARPNPDPERRSELLTIKECYEDFLADLKSIRQEDWISVSDRLPEHHSEFLAFLKKTETNWLKQDVIMKAWVLDSRTTHWMPLPKPPKE